jgi:hypothetical protein
VKDQHTLVEIAMILADGWLRLADTRTDADAGVPSRKSSISLAINLDRRDVSNPALNSASLSPERGSHV